jgi:hypothetical protein
VRGISNRSPQSAKSHKLLKNRTFLGNCRCIPPKIPDKTRPTLLVTLIGTLAVTALGIDSFGALAAAALPTECALEQIVAPQWEAFCGEGFERSDSHFVDRVAVDESFRRLEIPHWLVESH